MTSQTQQQNRPIPMHHKAAAMPTTDGTERAYRLPEDGPLPDLPLYERLIDDGIAAADAQGSQIGIATPLAFTPEDDVPEIRTDLAELEDMKVLIDLGVTDQASEQLPLSAPRMQRLMRGMRVERALVCPLVSRDELVGYLVLGFARHARPLTSAEADAVLEVIDTGPGLTPEQAERVFERFYRADAARTRAQGRTGTGLGLAIVAALVAAHGGSVSVDSRPGEGATFRMRLPVADENAPGEASGGESVAEAGGRAGPTPGQSTPEPPGRPTPGA